MIRVVSLKKMCIMQASIWIPWQKSDMRMLSEGSVSELWEELRHDRREIISEESESVHYVLH